MICEFSLKLPLPSRIHAYTTPDFRPVAFTTCHYSEPLPRKKSQQFSVSVYVFFAWPLTFAMQYRSARLSGNVNGPGP